MGISSSGIGSGLDIPALVKSLVDSEIAPRQRSHDKKLETINTQLSSVGQIKNSLTSLQDTLVNLADISKIYCLKASISDETSLSATASSSANTGTYQIQIQNLAQSHSVASSVFSSTVAGGTLNINFGTYSTNTSVFTPNPNAPSAQININPGDSLVAIQNAINNANAGVTASIIQDNSGSRLTITSQNGENYAMQISGVAELTFDPTSANPIDNKLTQTVAAQNSTVSINGLVLVQNSNELKDAISGVTLNLKKAQTGVITLNIDRDQNKLSDLINEFVKKYNDSMTVLNNVTNYDSTKKHSGVYSGDSQFRSLKLNMNRLATNTLATNAAGSILCLADLGITTNERTGLLDIDTTKLDAMLTSNYADIGALFAKTANATDPNISINGIDSTVKSGLYDVNITQYTPALTGTIGGFDATSTDGVTLTGSGDLAGLSINILSETLGARGQIRVTDGLAVLLNDFIETYVSDDGSLNERTEQLNEKAKMLENVQTKIKAKSDTLEKRYFKQFTALDVLIGQMQATSSYLTQQLSNLPGFTTKFDNK